MLRPIKLICIFLAMLISLQASAQDDFPLKKTRGYFQYEFVKPEAAFFDEVNTSFLTGAHFFNFRVPMDRRISLVVGLPLANLGFSEDVSGQNVSGTEIGNPYIGLQFHRPRSDFYGEIGTRLPLIDAEEFRAVHSIAAFADITKRFDAFLPEVLPIQVMFGNRFQNRPNGAFLSFRSGGSLLLNLGDGDPLGLTDDTEFQLLNQLQAGVENRQARFAVTYNTRWFATEDAGFSDAFFQSLGVQADLKFRSFAPYVSFRKPLNETYSDLIDYQIIFGVRIIGLGR